MCTLIVLDRITPGYPLVVASNRDEFYSRPAAPPARVDSEQDRPPFVAPQDLEVRRLRREVPESRGDRGLSEDIERVKSAVLEDKFNPCRL